MILDYLKGGCLVAVIIGLQLVGFCLLYRQFMT
jgi:hypothetical protein